jgi:hypothetical protein
MFDWNAELEVAKRRVAELEETVSRLQEVLAQTADDPTTNLVEVALRRPQAG